MNSVLTTEEVLQILKNDTAGNDIEIIRFSLDAVSINPTGFLGEHEILTVSIRRGKEHLKKMYFVKKAPERVFAQKEYVRQLGCFYKEIGMYGAVFPSLKENAYRLPKWHPNLYFSRGEELMVLEDLTQSGYYMYPQRALMDEEYVLSSLEALAYMHASSIIYEEKLRERGDSFTLAQKFPHYLLESFDSKEERSWKKVYETAIAAQVKLTDFLEGYAAEQKKVIQAELPLRMRRLPILSKPSQKFRNVIIHGDLWTNNLLFLRGKDGKVKNAQIVDFQFVRYAPPAQDILIFLHTVQNREFREKNHFKLLNHYYNTLSSCLAKHGLKADDFLTWYELLGTCDHYEELGLLTAIYFFQLILAPPDICKKFLSSSESYHNFAFVDRSELVTECFLNDSIYRERVTEAMNILINEYIL